MPYKDTVDDFNLKWMHTFITYKGEIAYVYGAYYDKDERETNEDTWFVQLGTFNKKKESLYDFDESQMSAILVNSQFFNSGDLEGPSLISNLTTACLQVSRNPRRQNKRSICTDNITLTSPMLRLISQIKSRWPGYYNLGFEHVAAITTEVFPSYLQSLEYCKKHGAVALSPDFAVGLSSLARNKYLFISPFGFIGECDAENIYVKHPGSLQEVNDFVNRKRLDLRVIDATK